VTEKAGRMFVVLQQCGDFGAQTGVVAAPLVEEGVPRLPRQLAGRAKQVIDAGEPLRSQVDRLPLSSLASHARAMRQSASTVLRETLSTSAISSSVSPPKKRSSTTRPLRASNSARRFS